MTEETLQAPLVTHVGLPTPSPSKGWCALNSAHVYECGALVALAYRGSTALGWLCPPCVGRHQR